jgi:hypothetical protein
VVSTNVNFSESNTFQVLRDVESIIVVHVLNLHQNTSPYSVDTPVFLHLASMKCYVLYCSTVVIVEILVISWVKFTILCSQKQSFIIYAISISARSLVRRN